MSDVWDISGSVILLYESVWFVASERGLSRCPESQTAVKINKKMMTKIRAEEKKFCGFFFLGLRTFLKAHANP